LTIKARIKEFENLDVRIAIGIGSLEKQHHTNKISESNGSAYVRSGEAFEKIKKRTLVFKDGDTKNTALWNGVFELAMVIADGWSPTVAKVIKTTIDKNKLTKSELAKSLNRSQSTISETLKRGGYDELININQLFENRIK